MITIPARGLKLQYPSSAIAASVHGSYENSMAKLLICNAGAVSGVQGSLQSLFQTLSYVVGIAMHRAEDFTWLMAGSVSIVTIAATTFTTFAMRFHGAAASGGTLVSGKFTLVPHSDNAIEMTKASGDSADVKLQSTELK